jgi:predicted transcriptional regulator
MRALMARAIIKKHRMKERQVAELLSLSQSAISRYATRDRGNIIAIENVPEVQKLIDQMTTFLIYEPQKKTEILNLFCAACKIIRQKGLLCQFCREKIHKNKKWTESCAFCRSI